MFKYVNCHHARKWDVKNSYGVLRRVAWGKVASVGGSAFGSRMSLSDLIGKVNASLMSNPPKESCLWVLPSAAKTGISPAYCKWKPHLFSNTQCLRCGTSRLSPHSGLEIHFLVCAWHPFELAMWYRHRIKNPNLIPKGGCFFPAGYLLLIHCWWCHVF